MYKIYYLSTCSTGKDIFKMVNAAAFIEKYKPQMVEIKSQGITEKQLDELKELAGSYEALFSRKAIKYKEWDLKNKILAEPDYKTT